MVIDTRELKTPLHKVVDLGIIDSWLRGASCLAPQRGQPGPEAFNMHTLHHGSHEKISHDEIRSLAGFRHLLEACSRNDVRLSLSGGDHGDLVIVFKPDEPFLNSEIFGTKCTATMPVYLAEWMERMKKQ